MQVAEFKAANDPAVIGVFSGADAKEFKAFESAADGMRSDFDFAHAFDASLVDEVRVIDSSLVLLCIFAHMLKLH